MRQGLSDKLQAILGRFAGIAGEQPMLLSVFAALLLAGTLATVVAVLRGRARERRTQPDAARSRQR